MEWACPILEFSSSRNLACMHCEAGGELGNVVLSRSPLVALLVAAVRLLLD